MQDDLALDFRLMAAHERDLVLRGKGDVGEAPLHRRRTASLPVGNDTVDTKPFHIALDTLVVLRTEAAGIDSVSV